MTCSLCVSLFDSQVNETNLHSLTPLHIAAAQGGADLNFCYDFRSQLRKAERSKVKLKSPKDQKTKQVTLSDLPWQGYRCCRYLVKAQADVKQKASHCASFVHGLVVKKCLVRVCSLSKDSSKRTPLDAAMEGGSNLAFRKTIQKLQSSDSFKKHEMS